MPWYDPTTWGVVEDFMNSGKSKFEPGEIGVNRQFLGGNPNGARDAANRQLAGEDLNNSRSDWYGRGAGEAYNTMMGGPGLSSENGYLSGVQGDSMGLMRDAAMGNAPSVAQMQMRQGLSQALGSQQAIAGSARGAGALALAGGNMANNTANLQNQGYMNSGMLRAQEMAQARGAYGDAAMQRLGLSNTMGMNNANNTNAYRLGVGNVGAAYGNIGLGYGKVAQDYGTNAMRPAEQQLASDNLYEQGRVGSATDLSHMRAGISGTNAAVGRENLMFGLKAAGGAMANNTANQSEGAKKEDD